MAISVVLAAEAIADGLVAKIAERIPGIKVGPGNEPGNEMGPLITAEHRDKVRGYIEGAAGEGATVVVDGTADVPAGGFFVKPTLLDNVEPGMRCYDDEIFGPVLSVKRVHGYADGVEVINANPFANLATLVVVDWLVDTSLGGTADTHEWYLFRSPSLLPAMLVLALDGQVEPRVETSEADFNVLGVRMRGWSGIGVSRGEPLSGLRIEGLPEGT